MRLSALVVALLLGAAPAFAHASTLEKAARILEQQAKRGKGEFITFLMGAASAYRWDASGVCPPARTTLEGRTYAQIALEEYRRDPHEYASLKDYPLDVLALALQRGLRARYPCTDRPAEAAAPEIDETAHTE